MLLAVNVTSTLLTYAHDVLTQLSQPSDPESMAFVCQSPPAGIYMGVMLAQLTVVVCIMMVV